MHRIEADLPETANWDDLTADMARVLARELEAYLAKVARFNLLYPDPSK